ncbi:hypothetical protein [Novosphingobium sp. HII-3]|uniref:hypothetical protein n=1 Tax=Novosphingobium sp. HII-3 TaxID=2075565 RepID=UPI000CDB61AC|nr:hypothetical protein [Novosphingobium sp. HII-3]
MEFRIEQDASNPQTFYATSVYDAAEAAGFVRSFYAELKAGNDPSEVGAAFRRAMAENAANAFEQMQVHTWLENCPKHTVKCQMRVKHEEGSLPQPQISIAFSDRKRAAAFAIRFT